MTQTALERPRARAPLWQRLLDEARALVPQAQAVSLWCRSNIDAQLRFQLGWGFGRPEAFLHIALEPDSPWGRTLEQGHPYVLNPAEWEGLLQKYPFWFRLYQEARAPRTRPPRFTLLMPWSQASSVVAFDLWEDPTDDFRPPTMDAWQRLLERHRRLGYILAGWSAFEMPIGRALDTFPQLLTIVPEAFCTTALDILKTILPYDRALALIHEGDAFQVHGWRGPEGQDSAMLQRAQSLLDRIQQHPSPVWEPTATLNGHPGTLLALPVLNPETDDLMGLLLIERDEPHGFLGDEVRMAMRFAHGLGHFLLHNQAYTEARETRLALERRTQHLEALYRLSEELTQTLNPEQLWATTARHLRDTLYARRVLGWRVDEDEQRLRLTVHLPEQPEPPIRALSLEEGRALLEHLETQHVRQLEPEERPTWLPEAIQALRASTARLLLLPVGQAEERYGFFMVERESSFLPEEQELARAMARHLATALANARLFHLTQNLTRELERRVQERTRALEQERRRAQLLAYIFAQLAGSLDLDEILNRTLETLVEGLQVDQALVVVARGEEPHLFWRAGRGDRRPAYGGEPTPIPRDDPLAYQLLRKRVPVVLHHIQQAPYDLERWWSWLGRRYTSLVAVPLLIGAESLGGLILLRARPSTWDPDDVDMLQTIGMQMASAVQNAELFEIIQEQAENLGALFRQQQIEAQRAKAILDSVADGILVTDAQGQITLFNPSAERLLGIQARDVLGRPLEHFLGLFGPAARQWMEAIQRWSREAEVSQQDVAETQIEMEDGRVLSVRLAPVFLQREFLGTVSVIRDITHHIEVDRMKSAFVANVSHELRTPLTAIKGYVEVLLSGMAGDLTERQRHFLNIILNHADRLINLVNDLLDLSRLEAGRIRLQPERLELEPLIRDLVRDFRRRVEKENRQLTLKREIEPDLPPVYADPKRTEQILANLLENAVRYTPDGGTIWVSARRYDDQYVVVAVKDTGIGIPPEDQDKIFERFYRGQHPLVLATPGTGLGLPIVRQLVEMQGGRIWLESTGVPGEGTTFYFTIPIYTGQEPLPEGRT